MPNPLAPDLDHILESTESLWDDLKAARIFITGGTGFFGKWLLESFAWANKKKNLGASAVVLSRNEYAGRRPAPREGRPALCCNHESITLHGGDVRSFAFPDGDFSHIIHAATPADTVLDKEDPELMLETITKGTERVLQFGTERDVQRMLYVSSGAVYRPQSPDISHVEEDDALPNPNNLTSAYARGKRLAEMMCKDSSLNISIARCFAFVGPYLPLDKHFAIGNFIGDALRGGPIHVHGDGTPLRSYLSATDLMIWLWTILLRGESGRSYNVGSEESISIADLATLVARCIDPPVDVAIAEKPDPNAPVLQYVPSTKRAQKELNLAQTISLEDAIRRTIEWNG